MVSREAALRALHAQVDFEVVGKGGELSAAVARNAQAGRRAQEGSAQCAALLGELRRLQSTGALNPAAIDSLRRAYRLALEREMTLQGEHRQAMVAEDELRKTLAALRHRSRHLKRAAQDEAATTALARAAHDGAQLDDLWLATHRRMGR